MKKETKKLRNSNYPSLDLIKYRLKFRLVASKYKVYCTLLEIQLSQATIQGVPYSKITRKI